ncbi:DUF58 domain-containing protein [Vibrio profundi]|uniref:DUF58 domain-containing protein n=1 Tax=Vibrio profundi TaxID=1774960 RepID=UPI003735177F
MNPLYEGLKHDRRVYTQLELLYLIKCATNTKSKFPELVNARSPSGAHLSTHRGRGLNFEELRRYQRGDDVRHIDWKTTLRTGKPHVRAYSEEKEQNVLICVDQRESMFFSSVETMKSVVAANVAAYCIWSVIGKGDRIGTLISRDEESIFIPCKKGESHAKGILQQLHTQNHRLGEDIAFVDQSKSFLKQLKCIQKRNVVNTTIIIISDWYGLEASSMRLIQHLQKSNRIIGVQIIDPIEANIHDWEGVNISDGQHQLQLSQLGLTNNDVLQQYSDAVEEQFKLLSKRLSTAEFPLITLTTDGHEIEAFRSYFL